MLHQHQVTHRAWFQTFIEKFLQGIPFGIQIAHHIRRLVSSAFVTDGCTLEEVLQIKPFLDR